MSGLDEVLREKKIDMNKVIQVLITIFIVGSITVGSVMYGPGIIEQYQKDVESSNYLLKFSSPDADDLDLYWCEDNREVFTSGEYAKPAYDFLDFNEGSFELPFRTVSKLAISYIYVKEFVYRDGLANVTESPEYRFTYQSLVDNGGFANLTLVDTYLLLEIIPW
jgi:hypothetical protein